MNINRRGTKMNESVVMRASEMDKVHLKMMALERGTSVSQLIREQLIQNRILPATWPSEDEF